MSIPPLVCSTPPPLEQIECDNIRHDEFAIQYGLSQDEEDDFCRYDDFNSAVPTSPRITHNNNTEELVNSSSVSPVTPDEKEINDICTGKDDNQYNVDKDSNNVIEDLDLKFEPLPSISNIEVEAEKDSLANIPLPNTPSNCILNEESLKQTGSDINYNNCIVNIKSQDGTVALESNAKNTDKNEHQYPRTYSPSTEKFQDSESNINLTESSCVELSGDLSLGNEEDLNDFHFVPTEINFEQEVLGDLGFHSITSAKTIEQLKSDQPSQAGEDNAKKIEDEFEEFDAFHKNESVNNIIENGPAGGNIDPWQNGEDPVSDFGNFQATFNDSEDHDNNSVHTEVSGNVSNSLLPAIEGDENEDEFGDFDDFQSSHVLPSCGENDITNEESNFSMKSFDLKNVDNENQFYESVEKVIHSLFNENIAEQAQGSFESNLESSLCETWGYLIETEVRQPYMLNWNNSIGQKTLLKSLCIDSRNILFGPKWNNMPRYAANLCVTPLQPVRQVSVSSNSAGVPNSTVPEADKPKPIESWSDSVHGGQESCNDKDSTIKVPAVHTDVITRVTKEEILGPSKVFPGAHTMQPLRQINLPDTHIFTPTDSEVPRSKTIHYDNIAPITSQLPHNVVCSQSEFTHTSEQQNDKDTSNHLNCDYEDFQEFQANSTQQQSNFISPCEFPDTSKDSLTSFTNVKMEVASHSGHVTYQMQTILEPIKLEPSIPKLNWPDPGEVKETFEDFTEFVTHSTWASSSNSSSSQNISNDVLKNVENSPTEIPPTSEAIKPTSDTYISEEADDEFDNFKFAPTESPANKSKPFSPLEEIKHVAGNTILNNISSNGLLHPMAPLQMQTTTIPTNPTFNSFNTTHSQIMQPVSFDQNSQIDKTNSQQILQPLSLESFSQINWPSPGVSLHDLSRFNPINAVHTLYECSSGGKQASPAHNIKSQPQEDDWGDFVSIKPTKSPQHGAAKPVIDDDDWSDFVSSGSCKTLNGLNTISFNVHTNLAQKSLASNRTQPDDTRVTIPTLNYITPKSNHRTARDGHFQNL